MLNTNNLNYWTLSKFPYILTPVSNVMLFSLNRGQTASISTVKHVFCYVKSGSVKATFESYVDMKRNEQLHMAAGNFVQWSDKGFVEFSSTEENTRILTVIFRIMRPYHSEYREQVDYVDFQSSVSMQELSIEMPHTLQFEMASVERGLLESMCKEVSSRQVGYYNKLQLLLSQFVVEIVRGHPRMPRYVDTVAVTSNTDNDCPLKKGREVFVRDVEIWCNNPEAENSFLLRTMRVDRFLASNNGNTTEKIDYESVFDTDGTRVGKMSAREKDLCYKVLLWPDEGIKPFDIELYVQQWLYLRTRIKSNMTGNVGLAIYSTKGHHWFGGSVMIEKPGEWIDVLIPVMQVQSSVGTSAIVANAMQYIHENYTGKITLRSVAEAIFTNPNYLSTVFSREKGMTFTAYVRNYRLAVAQKMLVENDDSIENVALAVGFYDIQHFSKMFRKEFGVSPMNFRKVNRKK